jgi:hypothetical protein
MLPHNLSPEYLEKSPERKTMNESRTITIELPSRDWQLLEAEALLTNQSAQSLVLQVLRERYSQRQIEETVDALQKLSEIGDRQGNFDPVEMIRYGREELSERCIF